jgi:cbb3-type cytochrome oxidase subunit 3
MKRLPKHAPTTRGSVAVEMAMILPILLLVLAVPLFFARVFWVYSVGQKAAHDAARYLSTATQAEMRTPGGGFNEARVAAVARWIAQQELEEIVPFTDGIPIAVLCDSGPCGGIIPQTVHVKIQINLHDGILENLTSEYIGNTSMVLFGDVTLRYVGN